MSKQSDDGIANRHKTHPRVAVVLARDCGYGGIESFLANALPVLCQWANITLLTPCVLYPSPFADVLQKAGIKVIEGGLSHPKGSFFERVVQAGKVVRYMGTVLRKHKFDVVHINSSSYWFCAACSYIAKSAGSTRIIVHSHTNAVERYPLAKLLRVKAFRLILCRSITHMTACSEEAGRYLFGKAWCGIVVPNGIDTHHFAPDAAQRAEVRRQLKASDSFVLGFVGRLSYEKNPEFALDVFAELLKERPDSQLWFVGDGELKTKMTTHAEELGIIEGVHFLGMCPDVKRYLDGMDLFMMPSLAEGLPLALLEAQANGLPCIVSDAVPETAVVNGCPVIRLPLADGPAIWSRAIINSKTGRNPEAHLAVKAAGFDRQSTIDALMGLYGLGCPNNEA